MNKKIFLWVPVFVLLVLLSVIVVTHLVAHSWVGEQSSNAGYFRKSIGLITDAPHATSELFYSSLENILILLVGISWGKWQWRREHEKFDREHGIEHE